MKNGLKNSVSDVKRRKPHLLSLCHPGNFGELFRKVETPPITSTTPVTLVQRNPVPDQFPNTMAWAAQEEAGAQKLAPLEELRVNPHEKWETLCIQTSK